MVSRTGGSPGHHLMGVAILDAKTGSRIGVVRALIRFILRTLLGWLSVVLVLTTRKHQALHDLVCRTNVVLLSPESLPEREKFTERITEDAKFLYPSKIRRVIVIAVYVILSLLVMGIAGTILLSESCLLANRCTPIETIVLLALNGALILGIGSSVVFGWQARLLGCRRTIIEFVGKEY